MSAIKQGELGSHYSGRHDGVPSKMFTLDSLSNTNGILDPDSGIDTTARGIMPLIDGFISVTDIYGNVTTPPVIKGIPLQGLINGIRTSGTTLTASQIIVLL